MIDNGFVKLCPLLSGHWKRSNIIPRSILSFTYTCDEYKMIKQYF